MHAHDLVKLNNEKRTELNEQNLSSYEEMLVYIRSKGSLSEQATEEILYELLEHLVEGQKEGKQATDIFGDDLKAYCDELIGEIPKEKSSRNAMFLGYLGVDLIGTIFLTLGIIGMGLFYFFEIGTGAVTIHIGSAILAILVNLVLIALFVWVILKWVNRDSFKEEKKGKWGEFFQIWLICTAFIGMSLLAFRFMPDFGEEMSISLLTVIIIGAALKVSTFALNRKYRFTK